MQQLFPGDVWTFFLIGQGQRGAMDGATEPRGRTRGSSLSAKEAFALRSNSCFLSLNF
jgi:hypothetical protein